MNIGVVIPSWNKERALQVAENLKKHDYSGLVKQVVISGANRTESRLGCVEAMALGAEKLKDCDLYIFCHDDIEVYEDWASSLSVFFKREWYDAGLAGFHGAKGLGTDDIYRTRYQLNQLARIDPMSNMVDAEAHGKRTGQVQEVATIDGFFMAVTKEVYQDVGGWAACLHDRIVYHMYDSWMAMAAREHGFKTYLIPVSCAHSGGRTEVGMAGEYEKWAIENGFKDASEVHTRGHLAFYERFRGQLPLRIQ